MSKQAGARPHSTAQRAQRTLTSQWGWLLLRGVVLGLSFMQLGCREMADAFSEIFVAFLAVAAAVLVVGMIVAAIVGFLMFVGFVFSLVMLLFNLTNPSSKTVVGAGVCGIVFAGSGVLGGGALIWSALEQGSKAAGVAAGAATGAAPSNPTHGVLLGLGWLTLHLLYAAALGGSAYMGQQKLKRAAVPQATMG